jgi:hypothetical protein
MIRLSEQEYLEQEIIANFSYYPGICKEDMRNTTGIKEFTDIS